MTYNAPASGVPVIKYVGNKNLWGDIVAMLGWWESTQQQTAEVIGKYGDVVPIGVNVSGVDIKAGELASITGTTPQTAGARPLIHQLGAPIVNVGLEAWPYCLANPAIINKLLPVGLSVPMSRASIYAVPGSLTLPTDNYVMANPAYPTRFKSADAGLYKVLAHLVNEAATESYLIVDTRFSQPIWRYAYDGFNYKLLRLDGLPFDVSITNDILFPFGVSDKGFCLQQGSKFIALNDEAVRPNWIGTLVNTYYSAGTTQFLVRPMVRLDGPMPSGSVYVQNIYKWDYGVAGALVRVEWDPNGAGRWIPLQQEYICKPVENLGSCTYGSPGDRRCDIRTQAGCVAPLENPVWVKDGVCPDPTGSCSDGVGGPCVDGLTESECLLSGSANPIWVQDGVCP